tara:strand:- start:220 stop:450 length:231 start_codon:yes stop_codon:yes gene_type:complete
MIEYDLLVSEDKRSYLINCVRRNDLLEVGAVFIAPSSSSPMKLIAEDGGKLIVTLPPNVVEQPIEMVAVDTSFFID